MLKEIKDGRTQFWKCYYVDRWDSLWAPFMQTEANPDSDGIIRSTRSNSAVTEVEKECHAIHCGVHVYAEKPTEGDGNIIIPVYVLPEDFVGCSASGRELVFTKIRINPKEVEELIAAVPDCQRYDPAMDEEDECDDDYDDFDDDDYEDDEDDEDYDDDYEDEEEETFDDEELE